MITPHDQRHDAPETTREERTTLLREIADLRSTPLATPDTGQQRAHAEPSTIAIHTAGCWAQPPTDDTATSVGRAAPDIPNPAGSP